MSFEGIITTILLTIAVGSVIFAVMWLVLENKKRKSTVGTKLIDAEAVTIKEAITELSEKELVKCASCGQSINKENAVKVATTNLGGYIHTTYWCQECYEEFMKELGYTE